MAEVYPTDNELLDLLADTETGVEYIPTGTAPYYLHFRRLLHRLLLACRRGNDLRVFDEGGLSIGVKAGKYWVGNDLVTYAGSFGNSLADNTTAYIYLDSSGTLVTDEYTAWPDMTMAKHVRLAVVTTLNGDITSVIDARDHHSIAMPGGSSSFTIVNHTADATLTEAQAGMVHTNRGATSMITLTLPAAAEEGTVFRFAVQEAQSFVIDPGAATIRDDSGQTPDKHIWANAIGECIMIVSDSNGDWMTLSKRGTWLQEP